MRYIIIGAGAVGGAIGGRLFESGHEVVLVARGAHLAALREGGLRLRTPEGSLTLPVPAAAGPGEVGLRPGDVLVLAVKTQHAVAALDAWAPYAAAAGGLPLLCAQNGVAGERLALRRGGGTSQAPRAWGKVYGVCVWLPSQHLEPGSVVAPCAPLTGMLHIGRYPEAAPDEPDETARAVAADLEKSRFLAPVVDDVMRWKHAKLLLNLGNAVEALVGRAGMAGAGEVVRRARAEGEAVLAAAGIPYVGQAEQDEMRAGRMDIQPIEEYGGGSTWQSLQRGAGSVEADYLNGEIVLLGRLHGVPTPVNEALRRAANAAATAGRGPGSMTPEELAGLVATG
jgi:2-dehydropantoate 2-reductase